MKIKFLSFCSLLIITNALPADRDDQQSTQSVELSSSIHFYQSTQSSEASISTTQTPQTSQSTLSNKKILTCEDIKYVNFFFFKL